MVPPCACGCGARCVRMLPSRERHLVALHAGAIVFLLKDLAMVWCGGLFWQWVVSEGSGSVVCTQRCLALRDSYLVHHSPWQCHTSIVATPHRVVGSEPNAKHNLVIKHVVDVTCLIAICCRRRNGHWYR